MKKLLLLFACFSFNYIAAQTLAPDVITTSGTSFNNGGSQLDWTLGEPVTATYNSSGNMLTQGFHQPNLLITSVENQETAYSVDVFPNPAIDYVQLQFKNLKEELLIELFAADGKLLESKQTITDIQFSMINYPAGAYLLSVKSGQSKIKTYKVIKSH